MPVKIRLMRIGTKKRPFYRVVAIDERKKRTGEYLELLGTYNPLTEPKEIKLDQAKIDAWIKKGAQPSVGFLRITGKAPQRPPRKPKKEKIPKATPVVKEATPTETPAEEAKSDGTEATSEVEQSSEPTKEPESEKQTRTPAKEKS